MRRGSQTFSGNYLFANVGERFCIIMSSVKSTFFETKVHWTRPEKSTAEAATTHQDWCFLQQDGIGFAQFSDGNPKPPCSSTNAGDKPVLAESRATATSWLMQVALKGQAHLHKGTLLQDCHGNTQGHLMKCTLSQSILTRFSFKQPWFLFFELEFSTCTSSLIFSSLIIPFSL